MPAATSPPLYSWGCCRRRAVVGSLALNESALSIGRHVGWDTQAQEIGPGLEKMRLAP